MTRPSSSPRLLPLLSATLLFSVSCTTEVARAPDEVGANRMVAALADEGIAADIRSEDARGVVSYAVSVPVAEGPRARIVLDRQELSAPRPEGLAGLIEGGGIVASPTEDGARLTHALQGELQATFESLEGVVAARVHLSVPPRSSGLAFGNAPTALPTASVVLRHLEEAAPLAEVDVQRIVSGAIAGLEPERVSVVFVRQRRPPSSASAVMVPLGPFSVSADSLGPLRLWLVVATSAVGLLGIGLVLVALRLRTLRRRLDEARK